MAEMSTGIMDLLSKLIGERENFLGKTNMPTGLKKGAVSEKEYQTLRDGGSEIPTELQGLKTPTNFLSKGGMSDEEFNTLKNGRNTYGATSDRGTYSDSNITGGQQQYLKAMNYVDDGDLSGFVQHNSPMLHGLGIDKISMQDMQNLPADAIRSQMMDIFKSSKLSGFPEGKPSQAGAVGAVSDREAQTLANIEMGKYGGGASSDVDNMFAQALSSMSPEQASEVIMTIQNYTPDQQQNFKAQFLQGNVPSYELENQSNLGF